MPRGKIGDVDSGLTKAEIEKWFYVHPEQGLFIWKCSHRKVRGGTIAGSIGAQGYVYLSFNNKRSRFRAHRVLWFYVYGEWPMTDVDHINLDKSDNRISNLRLATRAQNNINAPRHVNNISGKTGVNWCRTTNKWRAYITVDGCQIDLGRHETFENAVAARIDGEKTYYPEHMMAA